MKPKSIVTIIVVSVVLSMGALACVVLEYLPTEARLEAATQNPDPWKGLTKGWIILTFIDPQNKEMPYNAQFELVGGQALDTRAVPLPFPGERIKLQTHYGIWILEYRMKGEARIMDSPVTFRARAPGDETGVYLPPGTEVQVEQVRVGNLEDSLIMIVWALVPRLPSR